MRTITASVTAAAALSVVLLCGCGKIRTDYGYSKGISGRNSLNGFGALRASYVQAGYRSRDVTRLSDRVMLSDVIVWTPQVLGSVDTKVTRWFERWLVRGNRTLVYVVPDSGSEADYWADAAKLAAPQQRLEYRKRAARSINERMMWRLNRAKVASNGWFRLEPLEHRTKLGDVRGRWKADLGELSPQDADTSVEYLVAAFEADSNSAKTQTNPPFVAAGPTGPGSPGWVQTTETKPTRAPIRYQDRLSTEAGDGVVAEIRSENWEDSKIIVVAGGSLLTNYAFSRPLGRRLADKIVAESTPAGRQELLAGFLTSSWYQIPVSERQPGAPTASGMELLTVWPMSLVTMHAVMLGLVVCLMLLPIFGRPRRILRSKQSHFGDHLDAVAALMNRAGGERYARARISEYMKRMHGETSGPWVLPDRPRQAAGVTPPSGPPEREKSNQEEER